MLPDEFERIPYHGKRSKAKKIHLQQAEFFYCVFGELRCNCLVVPLQRHIFGNGFCADHHAGRMRGGMARQPLKLQGKINQLFDMLIRIIKIF